MLTTSMLPEKCHLIIEETVPRGMYVDPDQLRDLSESQGLQTFVSSKNEKNIQSVSELNKLIPVFLSFSSRVFLGISTSS